RRHLVGVAAGGGVRGPAAPAGRGAAPLPALRDQPVHRRRPHHLPAPDAAVRGADRGVPDRRATGAVRHLGAGPQLLESLAVLVLAKEASWPATEGFSSDSPCSPWS